MHQRREPLRLIKAHYSFKYILALSKRNRQNPQSSELGIPSDHFASMDEFALQLVAKIGYQLRRLHRQIAPSVEGESDSHIMEELGSVWTTTYQEVIAAYLLAVLGGKTRTEDIKSILGAGMCPENKQRFSVCVCLWGSRKACFDNVPRCCS